MIYFEKIFLNKLLGNNFRFVEELQTQCGEFLYTLYPVSSIINILNYFVTFMKTKKLTLVHYY